MSWEPERIPHFALRGEFGLVLPACGWRMWLADVHVLAAMLAAVPVWVGLGMTVGARMNVAAVWGAWVSLVLVQPLAEEIVFRGALQGRLLRLGLGRKAGPVSLANLVTTAVFVCMHLLTQPPAWAMAVAVPSLLFGHLRERFGSVLPALFLHAYYNLGFGIAAWWVHR